MRIYGRQVSSRAVGALAAVLAIGALLPVFSAPSVREIALVADDMAFHAAADPTHTNPIIEVRAGETVAVVVRNAERGMRHDFVVPALGVGMALLDFDEQGTVTFTAPSEPGDYEYVCRPHALMMRGVLRVVP